MIGRAASRAFSVSSRLLRPGNIAVAVTEWLSRLPGNRYSRRVALLKVALPAIGGTMLMLVIAWPRIVPLFDRLRFAAIDLREARELRMINPRYAGTDRNGRPFVVTATVGRQVPQRDDIMALDQPVADVQSHGGAKINMASDSGVYQTQTQVLDMFGKVVVKHEDGSTFTTTAARLDVANSAAEGHSPVEGHGPKGDLTAQGFQLIDKGAIVFFTGRSSLLLKGAAEQAPHVPPPAVPTPIAEAATQLEKAAMAQHAPTIHRPAAPAAKSAPHHAAAAHATKPPHPKPPAKKSD
jgi:lipopolysaccharide export system protein LptC